MRIAPSRFIGGWYVVAFAPHALHLWNRLTMPVMRTIDLRTAVFPPHVQPSITASQV